MEWRLVGCGENKSRRAAAAVVRKECPRLRTHRMRELRGARLRVQPPGVNREFWEILRPQNLRDDFVARLPLRLTFKIHDDPVPQRIW